VVPRKIDNALASLELGFQRNPMMGATCLRAQQDHDVRVLEQGLGVRGFRELVREIVHVRVIEHDVAKRVLNALGEVASNRAQAHDAKREVFGVGKITGFREVSHDVVESLSDFLRAIRPVNANDFALFHGFG